MKRVQERDSSPRSKRSRSSYSGPDHDMPRDRMSPEMDRRDGRGREPKPKPYRDYDHDMDFPPPRNKRYNSDDRMSDGGYAPPRQEKVPEYRSLCLSNIGSKIPDSLLKETLYREFKKFGEFNVNITYAGDQRVAYINFRYPEDAKIAKHTKGKMAIFDRPVRVEAVFNTRRSDSPGIEMQDNRASRDNSDGGGNMGRGGYGRNMSPPMQYRGRGGGGYRQNMGRYPGNHGDRGHHHDGPPRNQGGYGMDGSGGESDHMFNPNFQNAGSGLRRGPNEKFPYHLDHIKPEDDEKATRTLFVGNLDYNIEMDELRATFERFGPVEDIDIKRPQRGQGNAYAFIKFMILDYAHRAKVELSGQYIGRFQCKIGYGKVTPTTCLWVGGLGPWVTPETLEREFDRFGVIDRIEWPHGKHYAYVLYDNIDAATAACQEMRGFPLGGTDRRLRIDYADVSHITSSPRMHNDSIDNRNPPAPWRQHDGPGEPSRRRDDWNSDDGMNFRSPPDDRGHDNWERNDRHKPQRGGPPDDYNGSGRRSKSQDKFVNMKDRDMGKRENGRRQGQGENFSRDDQRRGYSDGRRISEGDSGNERSLDSIDNINDMAKCLPAAWNGALILKKSAFAARMHVVSGDVTIVDNMMRDPTTTETPVLKINQRLRLDGPKLEDVGRRVISAGPHGHCILLAMTGMLQNYEDSSVQQRPLKNLVTYLKQKDAAGVISLPNYECKDKENVGVLYAFPPCPFGLEYLAAKCPRLPSFKDQKQEDFMIIVVITGAV